MTPDAGSAQRPRSGLVALWRGKLPLKTAFWEYAVGYGTVLNLLTSILSFAVLAMKGPPLLALGCFFLPLPYNVTAVIGVWRSASAYRGEPRWADAARIGVVVWAVLATLI